MIKLIYYFIISIVFYKVNKERNVFIDLRTNIKNKRNVYIGENTYINGGYIFAGENSKIIIGKNCLISYNIHFRTKYHLINDLDTLINQQGHAEKDIIIGDNVLIGFGVQILSGVTIGNGAVIGAGAVVTKDVLPNGIYAGVPAKLLRFRGK